MGAKRDSLAADAFDATNRASATSRGVLPGSLASLDSTLPPTPLRDLLAADGATIFVLSADRELTRAVELAGGEQYPVRAVDDWGDLVAAAAARRARIVLLDADSVPVALTAAVEKLHEVAPMLVVLVAAKRDATESLMTLLAERKIHRLLIKPAADGITRLLLESAIARYLQLRDHYEPPTVVIDEMRPARRYRQPKSSWSAWLLATCLVTATFGAIIVGELYGVRWRESLDGLLSDRLNVELRGERPAGEASDPTARVVSAELEAVGSASARARPATDAAIDVGQSLPRVAGRSDAAEAHRPDADAQAPEPGDTARPPADTGEAEPAAIAATRSAHSPSRPTFPEETFDTSPVVGRVGSEQAATPVRPDSAPATRERLDGASTPLERRDSGSASLRLDSAPASPEPLDTATASLERLAASPPSLGRPASDQTPPDRFAVVPGSLAPDANASAASDRDSDANAAAAAEPETDAAATDLDAVLERIDAELADDRPLDPEGLLAAFERAIALSPYDPRVLARRTAIGTSFVDAARGALERGDLAQAQRLAEEAFRLGADRVALALLDRDLEDERRAQTRARHRELLATARELLRDGRLLDADGALAHLAALRRERSTVPGLAEAWRELTETVAANVRAAIDAQDFDAAKRWAAALAVEGGDPRRASELEFEARQAEFLATPVAAGELQLIDAPPPVYPIDARADGIEGWVDLEFIVDREGRPRDITVIDSRPGRRFVDAAVEAVANHRYVPFLLDRRVYERRVRLRLRFDLE